MPLDAANISKNAIDAVLLERAAEDFHIFVSLANPRFIFYRHCELLADVLERVASGEIKRLLIQLPPRHTKSEEVSRLFSAYYLKRNPSHFVGINSYSAELAYTLSRAARENYQQCGGSVKDDVSAVKHWETPEGGGCWAAGVGGSITGKGFHLGIIDDPVKNAEEASSETIREKHKEWYSSTFYTRAEPDAAIIVIQTRWHEDDLTGWILSEETGDEPENWHIVCLPAFYEEGIEKSFPDTCTVERDFRTASGEALCPERYPEPKLNKIRARIGEYYFDALYGQRPISKSGLMFDVSKFEIVDAVPVGTKLARGWDKAATPGGGDWTVGVKIGRCPDETFIVVDVERGQWNTATRDGQIRLTAELDGQSVKQYGEQEPGSAGVSDAAAFIKLLSGYPVEVEKVSGDKVTRADAYSSQVNAGNVKLLRGDWNKKYKDELQTFPKGKHDDQVDGSSLVFNKLNNAKQPAQFYSE
jgi:predicted phage terminase large subunit-like protein